MKKLIALTLVLIMVLSLCACTKSEKKPAETAAFQAGFGRTSITPNFSVPLSGYGNTTTRMSKGFVDYLYATCVAFQDAKGETVLLFTCDVINISESTYALCSEAISKATKIPVDHIIISGTHTHSGPDQGSAHASITQYKEFFKNALVDAAKAAIADLSPVTIKTGATTVEGLNFVRHYIMNDGTVSGDNFGSTASGYKDHEREADKEMQLVRLVRADKKKQDILMLNWQGHAKIASTNATPEGRYSRDMMSADYIGSVREYVEKEAGVLVAYYLGASGNLNALSNIQSEQKNVPQDFRVYGQQLGDFVLAALPNMKDVETGSIGTKRVMFQAEVDHTEDHMAPNAQIIADLWVKTNDYSVCANEGKQYGIISPYHATSIVARSKNPLTVKEMQINAVTIGNIGFATVPYEMFCQNGQAVKDGSPYETTFMITCCNGSNAYIAAEAAFEYNDGTGSYEVHNRTFSRGTAEAIQDELVSMLNGLKG